MTRRYEDTIDRLADEIGVPRAVAQALVDTENGARDPDLVMDRGLWGGGSYGLAMVTYPTAREYGYAGTREGLTDPSTSVRFGLRYLRAMFQKFGDWGKAYAAYNAGPDLSPWPAENVRRFNANLARWLGTGNFPGPPILTAGIGGLILTLAVLGWLLPMMLRPRRTRRARR